MFKYRKKPVVIEAWQFRRLNTNEDTVAYPQWFIAALGNGTVVDNGTTLSIKTDTHGVETANETDWIIQGVEGELYPCKDSVFQATYDKVE